MTPQPGDVYTAPIMVLKLKKGQPTVIAVNGKVYILQPTDMYQPKRGDKEG
ncbi:hypothetical protein D3C73_1578150 [compost metagenome]